MEVTLDRRAAVAALLAPRNDLFVVSGLGSTTYDVASLGDDARNFYLWGAMGGAAMIGLGLALARPRLRIAVITGDGEMLMGLGSLATIGVQRPGNLAVIVFDNGHYGETGMQPSHTGVQEHAGVPARAGVQAHAGAQGQAGEGALAGNGSRADSDSHAGAGVVDLCAAARACSIANVYDVTDEPALRRLAEKLAAFDQTLFARVRIAADEPPRVLPSRDGVELKLRFRRAVAAAGGG